MADASKERVLLSIPHPNDDHYGGALAFAPDGLLLASVGDGGGVGTKGGAGDVDNNAQNLDRLLGKLLRINPRPSADGSQPYTIPPAQPVRLGQGTNAGGGLGAAKPARPEIYSYGLRNPWRIHFDAAGVLWVADTGQASWEEVNRIAYDKARGANFGWKLREGTRAYKAGAKPKGAIDPIYEYPHADGRCAIIGGAVGRKGALAGAYVFGDLCSGTVRAIKATGGKYVETLLPIKLRAPTSVSLDAAGDVIVTGFYGVVARLDG